jgi:hypothetical protein
MPFRRVDRAVGGLNLQRLDSAVVAARLGTFTCKFSKIANKAQEFRNFGQVVYVISAMKAVAEGMTAL